MNAAKAHYENATVQLAYAQDHAAPSPEWSPTAPCIRARWRPAERPWFRSSISRRWWLGRMCR